MPVRAKSAADIEWYLYRSDAKLRMLFQQIAKTGASKAIEWKAEYSGVGLSRKSEANEEVHVDGMLKAMSETPNNAARDVVTTRLVPSCIRFLPDIDFSRTSPAPSMRLQAPGEPRTADYTAVARSERDGLAVRRETEGRQTAAKS